MSESLWREGAIFAGKYRIEEVLGRGGMAVVLGASHMTLDQPVAIKVLLPELMETPGVVDRFLGEARAVAKIKSEHVTRVLDVDRLPSGLPFFVMERLEGLDLAALTRRKRSLGIEEAVGYVFEACAAVIEAHARGIVHRDLKPGNIFLAQRPDGSSVIKVLDFGISKLPQDNEEHAVTEVGVALGSPSYMSPEQMRSARDVDARTDIWALGAVLFRLLTGKPPFRADNLAQLYTLVAGTAVQRPSALRPDIPPELEAVLLRCLEKDPASRYASAMELAEALLPFAGPDASLPPPPSIASRASRVSLVGLASLSEVPSSRACGPIAGVSPPREPPPSCPQLGSVPRQIEATPACDRGVATNPEGRATLGANDSTPLATSAVGSRRGADPRWASPRKRRDAARAVMIAASLAILLAVAGVRVAHRAANPVAAGTIEPIVTPVVSNQEVAGPVNGTPSASAGAEPSPSVDAGAGSPAVVPVHGGIAGAPTSKASSQPSAKVASTAASSRPPGNAARRGKVGWPVGVAMDDPFRGGRK